MNHQQPVDLSRSVAITGIGIISAIGTNAAQVAKSLCQGKSGAGPIKHLATSLTLPCAEVPLSNQELKQQLGISGDTEMSRTPMLAAIALREALNSAGIDDVTQFRHSLLVSGTTVAGMDLTEQRFEEMMAGGNNHSYFIQHTCGSSTDLAMELSQQFDEATSISTACSSAANAIMLAARRLLDGSADMVAAGGTEALSRFHLNGFNSLMILDGNPCRPFDATRCGLNLGEGAAYLILERGDKALQRGADIIAWLSGWGNACDAFHQTATSEDGTGPRLAMTEALRCSGLNASDIDYVNAHGTGTPNNDTSESAALRAVFGDTMPPVSSTKGMTGHATSAAGAIESAISVIALQKGIIPPSVGCTTPDPECITPVLQVTFRELHHVMCNSFGFGGNDTSLIFSSTPIAQASHGTKCHCIEAAHAIVDDNSDLSAVKQWCKPMELRRMGAVLKASILAAMRALEQAGIDSPDAIIAATDYGCWENSGKFLEQLITNGEATLQPTAFIHSTHNTPASVIALRTKCHGYNATYSHGENSMADAMADAQLLIAEGAVNNVLVLCFEESTELLRRYAGRQSAPAVFAEAIVLKATDTQDNDNKHYAPGNFCSVEKLDDSTCSVTLNPDSIVYKAHFPGTPITPGVCMLAMARIGAGSLLNRGLKITDVHNVKFVNVLSPNDTIKVSISYSALDELPDGSIKIKCNVLDSDKVYAKISMTCR